MRGRGKRMRNRETDRQQTLETECDLQRHSQHPFPQTRLRLPSAPLGWLHYYIHPWMRLELLVTSHFPQSSTSHPCCHRDQIFTNWPLRDPPKAYKNNHWTPFEVILLSNFWVITSTSVDCSVCSCVKPSGKGWRDGEVASGSIRGLKAQGKWGLAW